jgi:hypothetical protein
MLRGRRAVVDLVPPRYPPLNRPVDKVTAKAIKLGKKAQDEARAAVSRALMVLGTSSECESVRGGETPGEFVSGMQKGVISSRMISFARGADDWWIYETV